MSEDHDKLKHQRGVQEDMETMRAAVFKAQQASLQTEGSILNVKSGIIYSATPSDVSNANSQDNR